MGPSWILFCVAAVHVEDIIFHMFQYIQKLRTEGPQEWVFEECKVINVICSLTPSDNGPGQPNACYLWWEKERMKHRDTDSIITISSAKHGLPK